MVDGQVVVVAAGLDLAAAAALLMAELAPVAGTVASAVVA